MQEQKAEATAAAAQQTSQPPFLQQIQGFPQVPQPSAKQAKHIPQESATHQKPMPAELNGNGPDSNTAFQNALSNQELTISPKNLGFSPGSYWVNQCIRFSDLVTSFFHRKNNSNSRFPHKLYNALLLVKSDDSFWPLVGVKWVTQSAFKVDKLVFGRLLGIGSYDGGLFHRQGNFPSHGFKELTSEEVSKLQCAPELVAGVDYERIRVLTHKSGQFVQNCPEEFFNTCKWDSTSE